MFTIVEHRGGWVALDARGSGGGRWFRTHDAAIRYVATMVAYVLAVFNS